jgi:hypothetical protein
LTFKVSFGFVVEVSVEFFFFRIKEIEVETVLGVGETVIGGLRFSLVFIINEVSLGVKYSTIVAVRSGGAGTGVSWFSGKGWFFADIKRMSGILSEGDGETFGGLNMLST